MERTKNIRILLIDGDPNDADMIEGFLTGAHDRFSFPLPENVDFRRADKASEGLEWLVEEAAARIVLFGSPLPDDFHSDVLREMYLKAPEVSVIVLADDWKEELADTLLQNGVQDYLTKGTLDQAAFAHAVICAVKRQRHLAHMREKWEKTESMEKKLQRIVSENVDAIMVIDHRGTVCFANPAAGVMFGRDQTELLGSDFGFTVASDRAVELDIARGDGRVTTAELRAVETTWKGEPAYLATIRDVTEWKQQQRAGFRDSLTGLYNRRYFDEELKRLDEEECFPLHLIMGDVDNLKLVNDAFGHGAGDRLLVQAGHILRKTCRTHDVIARFGGDEFVILLPECGEDVAYRITDETKALCEYSVLGDVPVSISLGVASRLTPTQPLADILKVADERMYRDKFEESVNRRDVFISGLKKTLYTKDYATSDHTQRVRELSLRFGDSLRFEKRTFDELDVLAALHDIGKVTISESILRKPGPLTEEEWVVVRKHCEVGFRIAKATYGVGSTADNILAHQEWWDGNGYPRGIRGDEISLAARVFSIVDVFDVMTHDRPYKVAMSRGIALEEIRRGAGTQFDPELARAFLAFLR